MECDQVVARQRRYGAFASEPRRCTAIRVVGAEHERRERALRQAVRLRAFGGDRRELLVALTRHFALREIRALNHVSEQIEREAKIGAQRRQRQRRAIECAVGADGGAEAFLLLRDLHGVATACSGRHRRQHQTLRAERALRVSRNASVEIERDVGDRHGRTACINDFDAVVQARALHVREIKIGNRADVRHRLARRRRRRAIVRRWAIGRARLLVRLARARIDAQRIYRPRQPAAHRLAHGCRRHVTISAQIAFIEAWVAGHDRAVGECDGLAAESAHLLDRQHAAEDLLCRHALDFIRRRSRGEVFADDFIKTRGHRGRINARLHVNGDEKEADALERQHAGRNRNRTLFVAHQDAIEARTVKPAEHLRGDVELQRIFVRQAGHNPGPIKPRVGDAIMHRVINALAQRRDIGGGGNVVRPARDLAKIALHQWPRFGDIDIARQHDHRIVRTVIVAEPLAHFFERSVIEIGHRADGGVAIRVALRKETLKDAIEGHAVRLIVALSLFVLHDAALCIEALLRERAEDVAHSLALNVEAAIQRRGRHGLEIVGAVEPGGAIPICGAHFAQRLDQIRNVLGAVEEHDVFEQVREAGLPLRLILGAHIVPGSDGDDRRLAILVDQNSEPIVERELLVRNLHAFEEFGDRCRLLPAGRRRARCGAAAQGRRKHQCSRKRSFHSPLPFEP